MKKTVLVFGLIAGLIVSAVMALSTLILKKNQHAFEYGELLGYSSMLLAFSMIFVAIKSYRDRYNHGTISFKHAFLMGLGVATIASALYVVTWVFIYKFIFPDFIQVFTKCSVEKMQAQGKSAAEIQEMNKQMAYMFSYYDTWYGLVGITFMEIFPLGLLVTLICALVLKRNNAKTLSTQPI